MFGGFFLPIAETSLQGLEVFEIQPRHLRSRLRPGARLSGLLQCRSHSVEVDPAPLGHRDIGAKQIVPSVLISGIDFQGSAVVLDRPFALDLSLGYAYIAITCM